MIGSIIGDIVGSVYEFNNIKTKEFELFDFDGSYTDDSVLTFMEVKSHITIASMVRNTLGRWVDMEVISNFGLFARFGNKISDLTTAAAMGLPCVWDP